MNENALKYLLENKDKYSKEELIGNLRNTGYGEDDINEAVAVAYGSAGLGPGGSPMPPALAGSSTSFWDFRSTKVYVTKSEKVWDWIFGFFGMGIINGIVLSIVYMLLGMFMGSNYYDIPNIFEIFMGVALGGFGITGFVLYVAEFFYFRKRRKYIARGLLTQIIIVIAIPLLFLGFCLIIATTGGW